MEDSDLYPSKRLRTQTQTLAPPPAPSAKGKEKMEDAAAPAVEATCGICLSDGGLSIRGRIDSCDHFFCFVCIMEWAKIESLCPTCKRRFRSIRRPAVQGVFPCERVVDVPHRDQVYHPLGNESTGLSDPYEHINCSACHSSADEELLLLCDLCDSAVHTYCVGLGFTVPEGDWYCPDCAISRDEHSKTQSHADCYNQHSHRNLGSVGMSAPPVSLSEIVSDGIPSDSSQSFSTIRVLEERGNDDRPPFRNTSQRASRDSMLHTEHLSSPSSEPTVSIFDIVSDEQRNDDIPPSRNTSRRESQDSMLHTEQLSSPAIPVGETVPSNRATGVDKGPRTLSHCRNLHGRIRELRENWNALRAGSLAFSLSVFNGSDTPCDRKQKESGVSSDMSRLSDSSTLVNGEQMTADANSSGEKHNSRGSQDVNRAWKMMKIAKSIEGTQRSTIPNHSLISYGKRNVSKGADNLHPSSFISKGNNISTLKVSGSTESDDFRHFSLKTLRNKSKFQDCEKKNSDTKTMKEMQQICRGPGNTLLSGYSELASTKQHRFSVKDVCEGKEEPAPHRLLHKTSISFNKFDSQATPRSAACSLPEASNLSLKKSIEFSCSKVEPHKGKLGACTDADESSIQRNNIANNCAKGTNADESSIRRDGIANNIAKDEVRSLVKLNLKLLSRDLHLGGHDYKMVVKTSLLLILCPRARLHENSSSDKHISYDAHVIIPYLGVWEAVNFLLRKLS